MKCGFEFGRIFNGELGGVGGEVDVEVFEVCDSVGEVVDGGECG